MTADRWLHRGAADVTRAPCPHPRPRRWEPLDAERVVKVCRRCGERRSDPLPRCTGRTHSGDRCRAPGLHHGRRCGWHDGAAA